MRNGTLLCRATLGFVLGISFCCAHVSGQVPKAPEFSHDKAEAYVLGQTMTVKPLQSAVKEGKVALPRVCAPIRSIEYAGHPDAKVQLTPEIAEWIISFDPNVSDDPGFNIKFDAEPVALADLEPATASADGSILVHGYQATTHGEKLRYEPQPFKNTVGYWTVPTDYATWRIVVDQPGKFVVSLLQGCGKGNGGSQAAFTVLDKDDASVAELEFTVIETGHFQNFRWNEAGTITIGEPGEYTLKVQPKRIANVALGDIRMIHLSRQAE